MEQYKRNEASSAEEEDNVSNVKSTHIRHITCYGIYVFYPIVFGGCLFAIRSSFDRQRVTHYNVHASSYDTPRYQTQLISKFEAHTIIPLLQVDKNYWSKYYLKYC